MPTKFILKIDLGTYTMQNTYDVSRTLANLAAQILTDHEYKIICTHRGLTGIVRDDNGNIIGSWVVE